MPEQATTDEYKASIRQEIERHGDNFETAAGIIIGAASMCWATPEGAGVFDSQRASALVDLLVERMAVKA